MWEVVGLDDWPALHFSWLHLHVHLALTQINIWQEGRWGGRKTLSLFKENKITLDLGCCHEFSGSLEQATAKILAQEGRALLPQEETSSLGILASQLGLLCSFSLAGHDHAVLVFRGLLELVSSHTLMQLSIC